MSLAIPAPKPISIIPGSPEAVTYGMAQRAVTAAFTSIRSDSETAPNRLDALRFIVFLTQALPLEEGREKKTWELIQKRIEGDIDLSYIGSIIGLVPANFETKYKDALIRIVISNLENPTISAFIEKFKIRASTLPPTAADGETTVVQYRLNHRPHTPLDRFIGSVFDRSPKTTPEMILKYPEGLSGIKTHQVDGATDAHAAAILQKMFGTSISTNHVLRIFDFLPTTHKATQVELSRAFDGSVRVEAYIQDQRGEQTSRMAATILSAPPVGQFWKSTLDIAMDAHGLGAHLLAPFAMFISTLLAVQIIEVPQAHGGAPAFCEKQGFTMENHGRDAMGLVKLIIRDKLNEMEELGQIDSTDHFKYAQSADALTTLSEAAAFSVASKPLGREALHQVFSPEQAVSMSLKVSGRKAKDPLPGLVSKFFGKSFYPVEVASMHHFEDGESTITAVLNHWKDQEDLVLHMMESDENLAAQFVELLKTFSHKAQTPAEKDANLKHIANIMNTLSKFHPSICNLVIAKLGQQYQESASRSAMGIVFEIILALPNQGTDVPEEFLSLARRGLS